MTIVSYFRKISSNSNNLYMKHYRKMLRTYTECNIYSFPNETNDDTIRILTIRIISRSGVYFILKCVEERDDETMYFRWNRCCIVAVSIVSLDEFPV